jgi:hypothetical protein
MYRPPLPFYPEDGGKKYQILKINFFVVIAVRTTKPTKLYCFRKSYKTV